MRLLKVVCADFTTRNMRSDSKYRGHATVSVVQAVNQVQVAWAATARADSQLPGKLGLGSGRKSTYFFVAHLHPGDAFVTAHSVNYAIQRISNDAVDSLDSYLNQSFHGHLCYCWHVIRFLYRWDCRLGRVHLRE